ncbi:sigma-70 family RNA polymerase sigma factor [Aquimarina hainanensis]|uniref:Sigma-70 family RNA polymerase sigma factor n=1 Tax=Aquimarina hainanensis TaxID=1578017 RepID=A0ABW5N726_9FLAO|nr:sigma-70 family RNA polymerase sigma factor [Aquimarina sp. TRL1]QKX03862.1 sigma-70 family RNA polymerase sigma factor [Aquimarina sp. TRL1]
MIYRNKEKEFSDLFDQHYTPLYNYAFKRLGEKDMSEEIVQETFIKLWQNFESVQKEKRSVQSYLIIVLKNKIIDFYRKSKAREKNTNLYFINKELSEELDNEWEINSRIHEIYNSLQAKTAEIFQLSREKGLTYKEIAEKKEISVKSVEQHVSKALTTFRKGLKEFL